MPAQTLTNSQSETERATSWHTEGDFTSWMLTFSPLSSVNALSFCLSQQQQEQAKDLNMRLHLSAINMHAWIHSPMQSQFSGHLGDGWWGQWIFFMYMFYFTRWQYIMNVPLLHSTHFLSLFLSASKDLSIISKDGGWMDGQTRGRLDEMSGGKKLNISVKGAWISSTSALNGDAAEKYSWG